jgi:hypothetical protein
MTNYGEITAFQYDVARDYLDLNKQGFDHETAMQNLTTKYHKNGVAILSAVQYGVKWIKADREAAANYLR